MSGAGIGASAGASSGAMKICLLSPAVDAHTLGLASVAQLLESCGVECSVAEGEIRDAVGDPEPERNGRALRAWLLASGANAVGFSYRLDPEDGAALFGRFLSFLRDSGLAAAKGGPIERVYFAGLPGACDLVAQRFPSVSGLFHGEETAAETLEILGVPLSRLPAAAAAAVAYDEDRLAFGRELVAKGDYRAVLPVDRSGYPLFGLRGDSLAARSADAVRRGLPPLMRAHVGPYLPDRKAAVDLFVDWTARLARSGLLDVLSIGTSQLTQSAFGEDWGDRPNGGGVPINSPAEYERVWRAARPMLVRTYAGAKDVPSLARMHEETLDIAWHALSFWWFCEMDGRGPNSVSQNLSEHFAAMSWIAASGKPLEPNVPHHFAFRGADDATYVVSGYLAARAAKDAGVRRLVLQVMLNTPRRTWGVQDLAKARALLALVRPLEDERFAVYLQPRGGLDYFSPDAEKAKAQLAASTALMDDIESGDDTSPRAIHVVSYSEGTGLADPGVVEESARIVRHALAEYRRLRRAGAVDDMGRSADAAERTRALLSEARTVIAAIEGSIPDPYTPRGFYEILASGFLPVPQLSSCREEFERAVAWRTAFVDGGVKVVDQRGKPVPAALRMEEVAQAARRRASQA